MPGPSRPTPWRCSPWARSATPPRRPGAPPSAPPMPWSWPGPAGSRSGHRKQDSGLRFLEDQDEGVRRARLVRRYYTRQGHMHGECFYNGLCEPVEDTERMYPPRRRQLHRGRRAPGGGGYYVGVSPGRPRGPARTTRSRILPKPSTPLMGHPH